jgi:hypothetical protein
MLSMLNENFVFLGVALTALGGISYVIHTLRGEVRPNKITWLMWAIAPLIGFAAQLSEGVGIKALTTFIVGFMPALIFCASFVNPEAGWQTTRFDVFCGALSVLGLAQWAITSNADVAISFAMLADALAAVPTIRKAYTNPETESDTLFWLSIGNAAIGLLIIDTWGFKDYAFAAYLLLMNTLIALLIRFQPARLFARIPDEA